MLVRAVKKLLGNNYKVLINLNEKSIRKYSFYKVFLKHDEQHLIPLTYITEKLSKVGNMVTYKVRLPKRYEDIKAKEFFEVFILGNNILEYESRNLDDVIKEIARHYNSIMMALIKDDQVNPNKLTEQELRFIENSLKDTTTGKIIINKLKTLFEVNNAK